MIDSSEKRNHSLRRVCVILKGAVNNPISKMFISLPFYQGIKFNPDRLIVNTLKSHCMLDYAKAEGKQDLLAENLFAAYFEQGKNINSVDVLAKVAVDTGLNLENMEK